MGYSYTAICKGARYRMPCHRHVLKTCGPSHPVLAFICHAFMKDANFSPHPHMMVWCWVTNVRPCCSDLLNAHCCLLLACAPPHRMKCLVLLSISSRGTFLNCTDCKPWNVSAGRSSHSRSHSNLGLSPDQRYRHVVETQNLNPVPFGTSLVITEFRSSLSFCTVCSLSLILHVRDLTHGC